MRVDSNLGSSPFVIALNNYNYFVTVHGNRVRVYLTTPHFNNFNVHEVLKWSFSKYLLFTFSGPSSLYKVSGLLPKTFYHFRARARNLAGYSDHSNMIYLQTSATHAVGELLGSATTASKASVPTVITIQTLLLCSILSLIR